jgi:ribonuclease P protein component
MLPKQHRLKKDADFQKIWKSGRSFYTKILGFKVQKNGKEFSRFGIVVGNKVSKKSTERNILKRRLREILGKTIKNIGPGYDLVISALPGAAGKNYQDLANDVSAGLSGLKLLKQ